RMGRASGYNRGWRFYFNMEIFTMNNGLIRASIAELIGTFILVFVGGAAVASGQGVVTAALGHGLALCGIIFAYGSVSGANVNPAVRAGLLIGWQITVERAVYYWIAQIVGGIPAGLVVAAVIPDGARLGQTV